MRDQIAAQVLVALLTVSPVTAQQAQRPNSTRDVTSQPLFYCPMDPDVRAKSAGKCPKCGMALVARIPDPVEYRIALTTDPPAVLAAEPVELRFKITDPQTGALVKEFDIVHEKLFHLLIVSQDLSFFAHEHPALGSDGVFRLNMTFPNKASYRLLTDFYPTGASPQMIPISVTTAGFEDGIEPARLSADMQPQHGKNLTVSLRTEPAEPIAALKTLLFFELDTNDGLEPFLGAWAHLLAVSADGVDLIHAHPTIADGTRRIQVNMIFPRPGMYRIWIQTQRRGVVNTVAFNVPVKTLETTRTTMPRK